MAASLAFYSLFSLFPLLVGAIGVALYFVDAEALEAWVTPAPGNLSPGSAEFVEENVAALVRLRAGAGILAPWVSLGRRARSSGPSNAASTTPST